MGRKGRKLTEWDKRHLRDLQIYLDEVDELYDEAIDDAAHIEMLIDELDDEPFSWKQHPLALASITGILATLRKGLQRVIVSGITSEWSLSNEKNDALCDSILGNISASSSFGYTKGISESLRERYYSANEEARGAFIGRKVGGRTLSERVWKLTDGFKDEIEMALDIGIRDGRSADKISRDIREYLREPDKLFRRVRDEHGELHLSKAAAAYHPGRGVYRSSYMNAKRLVVTETNMAYREADYERWQKLDFVVGIQISLSNNHNCKGVPKGAFFDICDELQGKYPKDFKFLGWHPFCRCIATPILKNQAELDAGNPFLDENKKAKPGEDLTVRDVPEGFKAWVERNADRIERAREHGTLPWFLRDNEKWVKGMPMGKVKESSHAIKDHSDVVYKHGKGEVCISGLVNPEDSDYKKLVSVAEHFARGGETVVLTPKMSRPPKFEYSDVYGSLVGTKYEGKCPDLRVGDKWYEHEGFTSDNPKRAFRNMLNDGLKQSDRLIIDRPDLTDAYMKRVIRQRIKDGQDITEIWIKEGADITLLYKKV